MRFRYDKDVDALTILLVEDRSVCNTEMIDSGTLVDLDEHGSVLAIEVIHPARDWPIDAIADRFALDSENVGVLRELWGRTNHSGYPFSAGVATSSASPRVLV